MREKFFRTLSFSAIVALLVFAPTREATAQTCVQPPSGLVSWWPGDNNASDIADGNDGTLQNGATFATGKVGQAFSLDGVDDFVNVGNNPNINPTDAYTIDAWVKPDDFADAHGGAGFIIADGRDCCGWSEGGIGLHLASSQRPRAYFYRPDNSQVGLRGEPMTPEEWHHVAVTFNGTSLKIYQDGGLTASITFPPTTVKPGARDLQIGRHVDCLFGFCYTFHGLIDEVEIFNRTLSAEEIAVIYNAGSAGKCKELTIATRSVPPVKLGDPASYQLKAQLGTLPYSWSLSDGTLPPGMDLSAGGLLSGTPTEPGSFSFTVKVTDDHNDTAEKTFTQDVVLILPPPNIHIHKAGTAAVPGRTLDYFVVVENIGDVPAIDVKLLEFIEPWLTFVSADPAPSSIEQIPDNFPETEVGNPYNAFIEWIIPTLEPGEVRILFYKATLDPVFPEGEVVNGLLCRIPEEVDECLTSFTDCLIVTLGVCASEGGGRRACLTTLLVCEGQYLNCLFSKGLVPCPTFPQPSVRPRDPNEKVVLAKKFIQPDQLLVYPIHFENISNDVEARDIFVTDVLDPNLDTSTLNILTPDGESFDVTTRTLKWSLFGRNLQPHETDNVLLSIRPKPNLPSGTEIRNKATIQFEIFESLDTNEVVNIIDSTKPMCTMNPLSAQTSTLEFPISWSGTDAVGEIEAYSVLVSVDGGNFTSFLEKTSDTSATFTGELRKTYTFLCVATDTAGNIEVQDPVAETTTTLIPPADLMLKKGTLLLDPDLDEDKLTLQGTFAGSAQSINPPTEGVKIPLTDADGQIVALDFPAGTLWRTNQGPQWTFRNPTAGKTLTLQFNARTGTFSLRVKVRKVNLNDPDAGTITTSVMIGDNVFQNVQSWRSTAKGKKLVAP